MRTQRPHPLLATVLCAGLVVGAGLPAHGDTNTQSAPEGRFVVSGDTVVFDTDVLVGEKQFDIRQADVDDLRDVLRANPAVTRMEINSAGGGHYAALDLAAVVSDFELDTHILDTCESSCVTVFLGGIGRTMAKGGRVGFHQLSWNASAVEDYYTKNRDRRGWETPFEFAEWMYKDTQTETFNRMSFMVKRGVDAEFAMQTIRKPDSSMWFPDRATLRAAGVLTD